MTRTKVGSIFNDEITLLYDDYEIALYCCETSLQCNVTSLLIFEVIVDEGAEILLNEVVKNPEVPERILSIITQKSKIMNLISESREIALNAVRKVLKDWE